MSESNQTQPRLVVLSAPSGAGKSTICKLLVEQNPMFRISISATTRAPRPYETDGVHYYFLEEADFFRKVEEGDFLEHENVHGKYYGTLRSTVDEGLAKGHTILLDIDVNGGLEIKRNFPDALLIFIKPPSMDELRRRLEERKSESAEMIARRLERLPLEYEKAEKFDVEVINDTLEKAAREIESIIQNH